MIRLLIFVLMLSGCALNPAHEVTYDREEIRVSVNSHLSEVLHCHESIANHSKLFGKMTFSWEIVDEGLVKSVQLDLAKTTLRNPELESCLVAKIQSWKFPPPPPRQTITVNYPFVFQDAKALRLTPAQE